MEVNGAITDSLVRYSVSRLLYPCSGLPNREIQRMNFKILNTKQVRSTTGNLITRKTFTRLEICKNQKACQSSMNREKITVRRITKRKDRKRSKLTPFSSTHTTPNIANCIQSTKIFYTSRRRYQSTNLNLYKFLFGGLTMLRGEGDFAD